MLFFFLSFAKIAAIVDSPLNGVFKITVPGKRLTHFTLDPGSALVLRSYTASVATFHYDEEFDAVQIDVDGLPVCPYDRRMLVCRNKDRAKYDIIKKGMGFQIRLNSMNRVELHDQNICLTRSTHNDVFTFKCQEGNMTQYWAIFDIVDYSRNPFIYSKMGHLFGQADSTARL